MTHPPLQPASERLHGLDALRGFALLLGVVVHASMSFLPGAQFFWVAHDNDPSAALGLAFYVPHLFRMLLFFLLAGFFGRMACERLGTKTFVKDRVKRIALPLLAGWPLVFSAIVALLVWNAVLANGGAMPKESGPAPSFTPESFPLTHLWFLYALLLCYAAALIARWLSGIVDRRGAIGAGVDAVVRTLAGPAGPVLLALPLAAALFVQPNWYPWFGIPTPDQSLYPNLACTGFGSAFALGWLLHRQCGLLPNWAGRWPLHLALAVAATAGCLAFVGLAPDLTPAPRDAATLAYAAGYAFAAWNWAYGLTGLALRYLSGHSAARRYLADASYWIYLIHLPLMMALQVAVARLEMPAYLKFPLIVVAVLAVALLSYRWFVRYSFVGAMLNGRKAKPVRPRPSA